MKTASEKTGPPKKGLNWGTAIFLIISHVLAIGALFFWSWPALITGVILYCVANLGIGMGYHRLITHRAYKVPRPVEYFLVTCGALSLEGGPIQWVTTHRIHHDPCPSSVTAPVLDPNEPESTPMRCSMVT